MNDTLNARAKVLTLSPTKREEWRTAGKNAYKSTAQMMRNNSHHPDYNTHEKREAVHNANEYGTGPQASFQFTQAGVERLRSRFGYSEDAIVEAENAWMEGYKASRKWYAREDAKHQKVLDGYASLFEEASKVAHAVDVSDIKDGFPCGYAHVYLDYAERETPLGKALAHFSDSSTLTYKYRINIKMPTYGQCINYSERVCQAVADFLRSRGVLANMSSHID